MRTVQAVWSRADAADGPEPDFQAFTQMDVLNIVRRLIGELGTSAPTPRGGPCQDLRGASSFANNSAMQRRFAEGTLLGLPPPEETECRRCGRVHCDKVVYPAACVEGACPFVYAYEEFGHRYIGCMQKVYEVEIDIDVLQETEARQGGFGAVKAVRQPLPDVQGRGDRLL